MHAAPTRPPRRVVGGVYCDSMPACNSTQATAATAAAAAAADDDAPTQSGQVAPRLQDQGGKPSLCTTNPTTTSASSCKC